MKAFLLIASILCIAAAIAMYVIGDSSGHLSELKDLFYVPIPLGIILFAGYMKKSKE